MQGKKQFWLLILGVVIVFLAVVLPRIFELDRFATIDEPEWVFQSGNFYYALGQREFGETYRRNHPGVTAMWAGTAAYLIEFPEYRGLGQGYLPTHESEAYLNSKGQPPIDLLATARAFLVFGAAVTLAFAFYYVWRLFGPVVAVFGALLLAFDPFHTALSRILHHDATLGNMMFLSLVAMLCYYYRGRKWWDLLLSAFAAGMSFLAKSPGIFMFLFVGVVVIVLYFSLTKTDEDKPLGRFFMRYALPGLIWLLVAVGMVFLFWPALWVRPIEVLSNVFTVSAGYATRGHEVKVFFLGEARHGRMGWEFAHFYPVTIAYRLTPVTTLGLVLFIVGLFTKRDVLKDKENRQIILVQFFFVLLFAIFMTIGTKKFDRYLIPVYPLLDLWAAMGWLAAFSWLKDKLNFEWKQVYTYTAIVLLLAVQLAGTLSHFPYYFTYFNPFMGGLEKGHQAISLGWGEGLDIAAEYFNEMPDAEDLSISTSFGVGGFSFFFDGETLYPAIEFSKRIRNKDAEKLERVDYVLRYGPCQIPPCDTDYFKQFPMEHEIFIKGISFVRIYNVDDIPQAEMDAWMEKAKLAE